MKLSKPPSRSKRGKVFIDGDVVAYRSVFSPTTVSEESAKDKFDSLLFHIVLNACNSSEEEDFQIYFTGSNNYRFDIDPEYKKNRLGKERPTYLDQVRDYVVEEYGAIVSEGEEADDLLAIAATKEGRSAVVVSIDKDLLQVPCYHYNFSKDEWYEISPLEGISFFYQQILTGDRVDNIIGLYGVGPVKAKKILSDCKTEEDFWNTVVQAYEGDIDYVIKNARLLWLRRQEGETWSPPEKLNSQEENELSKQGTDQD